MAAKKSVSAADLIASARAPRLVLPAAVRTELTKILKHNDSAVKGQRVSADDVMALLATHGLRMARSKFDRLIEQEFSRKWGST